GLVQEVVEVALVDPQRLVLRRRVRDKRAAARRRGQAIRRAVHREQRHLQAIDVAPDVGDAGDEPAGGARRRRWLRDQLVLVHHGGVVRIRREVLVRQRERGRFRRQRRRHLGDRDEERRRVDGQRRTREDQPGDRRLVD